MARRAIPLIACIVLPWTVLAGQTRPPGPPPGTPVDVGGYRLHILCTGDFELFRVPETGGTVRDLQHASPDHDRSVENHNRLAMAALTDSLQHHPCG